MIDVDGVQCDLLVQYPWLAILYATPQDSQSGGHVNL